MRSKEINETNKKEIKQRLHARFDQIEKTIEYGSYINKKNSGDKINKLVKSLIKKNDYLQSNFL